MNESVDSNGDPVPEIVFEAFIQTTSGGNVVHIRVTGSRWDFNNCLSRFKDLCEQYQNQAKGYSHGW